MANPYGRTYDPNSIPKRKTTYPTSATRVAAHSENQSNNLSPQTAATSPKKMGKLGIRGDGQQA